MIPKPLKPIGRIGSQLPLTFVAVILSWNSRYSAVVTGGNEFTATTPEPEEYTERELGTVEGALSILPSVFYLALMMFVSNVIDVLPVVGPALMIIFGLMSFLSLSVVGEVTVNIRSEGKANVDGEDFVTRNGELQLSQKAKEEIMKDRLSQANDKVEP